MVDIHASGRDWEIEMKYKSSGFTLIETLLGMSMLAVVGMMTVPDFVVAADAASAQARWDMSVTAKNSHNDIATQTGSTPTVDALANGISGKAVSGGILVQVDGEDYTIPTYANSLCNEPTKNINEKVRCVGSIS
jgi:type II secretory pathway pseudopilin PulG